METVAETIHAVIAAKKAGLLSSSAAATAIKQALTKAGLAYG